MQIESTTFGVAEVDDFIAQLEDEDRLTLVERLRVASARLAELAPRVRQAAGEETWSAHEVLAHIAVLSKFYGVLTYRIGRGEMTELDLLGSVKQRDVAGEQMAKLPPEQLLESALRDHRRTLEYLSSASGRDLRRTAKISHGGEISAADIARLPLCTHLEQHVRQLAEALG
jgi:hypothetical protein